MGLVECQIFPKETPVRVYFTSGISWAFFPRNVFVLGRQMLQGVRLGCSKDRVGIALGFAAVSLWE